MIEEQPGDDWRDLQRRVEAILNECGVKAEAGKSLQVARGTVQIDVYAEDPTTTPHAIYFCECKRWRRRVRQGEVHAFRAVMADGGANFGLLISAIGFQSGAFEVAAYTNIRLLDWAGFQDLFVERWFRKHMAWILEGEGDALHEYTEPINSRIARKAEALPSAARERFRELRARYAGPSLELLMLWYSPFQVFDPAEAPGPPPLPLRASLGAGHIDLPADVLDATALRSLMQAVRRWYGEVTAQFDEVFGGRA